MQICIKKLYDEKNVTLDLNDDISIIMAENGQGKTTALRFVEALLTGNLENLLEYQFESVSLKRKKEKMITISKDEIEVPYFNLIRQIKQKNPRKCEQLKKDILLNYVSENDSEMQFRLRRMLLDADVHSEYLFSYIRHGRNDLFGKSEKVLKKINLLKEGNVLFWPTYRRVEKEIAIPNDSSEKEIQIAFGMKDVKNRFENVVRELSSAALNLSSNVNKKLIVDSMKNDLSKSVKTFYENIKENETDIDLMLDRTRITTEKNRLMKLIMSEGFVENKAGLAQIIYHLTEGFRQLKEKDEKIKKFVRVVNKYLVNNEFVYNDRQVEIYCQNKHNKKQIDLDYLSSGEKQLIGILSKLYMSEEKDYTIIIDEPEISLSTEWQEQLIGDLIKSSVVKKIICATHSPFIFKNGYVDKLIPLMVENG